MHCTTIYTLICVTLNVAVIICSVCIDFMWISLYKRVCFTIRLYGEYQALGASRGHLANEPYWAMFWGGEEMIWEDRSVQEWTLWRLRNVRYQWTRLPVKRDPAASRCVWNLTSLLGLSFKMGRGPLFKLLQSFHVQTSSLSSIFIFYRKYCLFKAPNWRC